MNMQGMNQEVYAEEALFQKYRNTKSSGYLDDQYELCGDFRQLEDYHFRIEDDHEIIQLQKLSKNSTPIQAAFAFQSHASEQFNNKMNSLLSSLDSVIPMNYNQHIMKPQIHGFYKIDENAYDEKKSLEAAYQHLQLNSLNKRMENLTVSELDSTKIKFKAPKKDNVMKQEKTKKQLISKMNKLSINDSQL